jgi:hypothetical protein
MEIVRTRPIAGERRGEMEEIVGGWLRATIKRLIEQEK